MGRPRRISEDDGLREFLHQHDITFQRTKTWKETNDPNAESKLARIEEATTRFPDRVFVFDEFGPLTIRPPAAPPGPRPGTRTGCPRTVTSCTASDNCTPATASATTPRGALSAARIPALPTALTGRRGAVKPLRGG
ncbi:hypothetical protein GCM10010399_42370 [Dactylosporangium fulvum]